MKEKSAAVVMHGYMFSYKTKQLSSYDLAVIHNAVGLLDKTNLFFALGGYVPGQKECGRMCDSTAKILSKLAPKAQVITPEVSGYDPTTKEIRHALELAKKHGIKVFYLSMLASHIPRTLWHYAWIMREMGIRVKIYSKPVFFCKGWFRKDPL